jgi:tRNA(fMet)-specific endonuclease VapC
VTASYLLDTNIASHIIKGDLPQVREQLARLPMHAMFVSAVTQAELAYGVAKRGRPAGLSKRVHEFLSRVTVLAWTESVAETYGSLRAACESAGVTLAAMDMMIAAHARTLQLEARRRGASSVLVTRDKAFTRIPASAAVLVTDWCKTD